MATKSCLADNPDNSTTFLTPPPTDGRRLHIATSGNLCNNNCIFCKDDKSGTERKLLTKQLLLEALETEDVPELEAIVFTRGEPTLNKNLPLLVKTAKDQGAKRVCLITNGRRLADLSLCRALADAGLDDVTVSIQGHRPRLHDFLTQRDGSFEQTARALHNLSRISAAPGLRFNTSTVVNRINLPFTGRIVDFLLGFGPGTIVFNVVEPFEDAAKHFSLLVPRYSEILKVFNSTGSMKNRLARHSSEIRLQGMPDCLILRAPDVAGFQENPSVRYMNEDAQPTPAAPGKQKTSACSACARNASCSGVYRLYIERFGDEEIMPVAGGKTAKQS